VFKSFLKIPIIGVTLFDLGMLYTSIRVVSENMKVKMIFRVSLLKAKRFQHFV